VQRRLSGVTYLTQINDNRQSERLGNKSGEMAK